MSLLQGVENFDPKLLKQIETQEKIVLPSAEGLFLAHFNRFSFSFYFCFFFRFILFIVLAVFITVLAIHISNIYKLTKRIFKKCASEMGILGM